MKKLAAGGAATILAAFDFMGTAQAFEVTASECIAEAPITSTFSPFLILAMSRR